MSPETQRGPALKTPGPDAAALQGVAAGTETTTLTRYPVSAAVGYAPAGRRLKFHTVVPECVFCGAAHVHRGTESQPARGAYKAGCGRGVYWLATLIVPTQRTAGGAS